MSGVGGHEDRAGNEGGRGDEEIGVGEEVPGTTQRRLEAAKEDSGFNTEWDDPEPAPQVIDDREILTPAVGMKGSVVEFSEADGRYGQGRRGKGGNPVHNPLMAAQEMDEDVGVEEPAHRSVLSERRL